MIIIANTKGRDSNVAGYHRRERGNAALTLAPSAPHFTELALVTFPAHVDFILGGKIIRPLPVDLNDSRQFVLAAEVEYKSRPDVIRAARRRSGIRVLVESEIGVAHRYG